MRKTPLPPLGGEKLKLMGLIGLMCLIGLMGSCTSDLVQSVAEPEPEQQVEEEEQGMPIGLECYVRNYRDYEPDEANGAKGMTRTDPEPPAWLPVGYSEDKNHKAIGAFFTKNDAEPLLRRFFYNTNTQDPEFPNPKWFISSKTIETGDFYLYGYMPYNAATVSITPNPTYDKGAILSFNNLESIMTKDVCVLVGAKEGSSSSTVSGLKTGQFGITMKEGKKENNDESKANYLFLLFEHIYARLDFRFRVDEEYAKLRTIKLRKVELRAYTSTNVDYSEPHEMKKSGSLEVHLVANDTDESPIDNDIRFIPTTTSEEKMGPVLLFEGEVPLPSSTEKYTAGDDVDASLIGQDKYTIETGYVPYYKFEENPDGAETKVLYVLHTTYDVYDKNTTTEHPEGNLIRKGCVADNAIKPRTLFGTEQLECGKQYVVKLTVAPTYLYVLSEPDLDNPTVVLN